MATRLVYLADTTLTQTRQGPCRFCERLPADAERLILSQWFAFPTDEAIQTRLVWLKTVAQRRYFFRIIGLLNILLNAKAIRDAEIVFCSAPHYFWWLLFLDRHGFLKLRGQRILIVYYLSNSFLRRLPWWKSAPRKFHAFFVSREQLADLEVRGCPVDNLSYVAFRIDTDWYRPTSTPRGSYFVVVGNIHRDERLIMELANQSPLPIIRIGQMGRLRDLYRNSQVQLAFNTSHVEYLDLLQNAAGLLLPIEPCDEPAGLTALLEALACEVPVIANASLEVGTLLERAVATKPLPDLEPATWRAAIHALLSGKGVSAETRRRGRAYVVAEHSLPDVDREWRSLLAPFAPLPAAC